MKITLYCIGRLKKGPLADLFSEYQMRLRYGAKLGPLLCREFEALPLKNPLELKARETQLLRESLPPKDGKTRLIVLDERGHHLDSEKFARVLGNWSDAGVKELVAIIGGANGLDSQIRELADLTLAIGAMTWPHLLVRCLIAEQLYRADSILAGHPYHRG